MKKLLKAIIIILIIFTLGNIAVKLPFALMEKIDSSMISSMDNDPKPVLVAHRGLSGLYPQNTVPAFEKAAEYGFWGYEFDIHTTKDGKWVVIHNDTVDDMTDGTGEVSSFTLEEIKKLRIDSGNGIENYSDLTVPTLEEALKVTKESPIIPVIEIKSCDTRYLSDMMEILDSAGVSDRAKIISFSREYLEACRALDENIEMLLLSDKPTAQDIDWCISNKNTAVNFNHKNLLKSLSAINYAKQQGITIAAWTVDNPIFAEILIRSGVKIITTNKIIP